MKLVLDRVLAWTITGTFIVGCYSIAHFVLRASDTTIMMFAGCLIWGDMAKFVGDDDDKKANT